MAEIDLSAVRIILVEPAGALNVGSVARVMKNMGLPHLVLVNPQCDPLGAEARLMAVHAADVLESASRVATLPEALQGCQRAIATTGRDRTTLNIALEHPRQALPWLVTDLPPDTRTALIFGREDSGLTNTELNYAQRLIRIPTCDAYPSMNLAQAVGLCCYELSQCSERSPCPSSPPTIDPAEPHPDPSPRVVADLPTPGSEAAPASDLASLDALEGLYQDLEALLLAIGYLYPHTAASRMTKFRRLLKRAYPSSVEVAMLRGVLSQVQWAIRTAAQGRSPD